MTENNIESQKAEKKPFYKRVWFWALIAVFVLAGLGSMGSSESASSSSEATGESQGDADSSVSEVSVPNVAGMTKESAETALWAENLEVEVRSDNGGEIDEDAEWIVTTQNPEGGSTAKEGDVIKLVVSKTLGEVTVPSVVNKDCNQAKNALEEIGLAVSIFSDNGVSVPSDSEKAAETLKNWNVVSQDPAAGTVLKEGETVLLEVTRIEKVINPEVSSTSSSGNQAGNVSSDSRESNISSVQPEESSDLYSKYAGYYELFRIDEQRGMFGDWVSASAEDAGFAGDYVSLSDDGYLNLSASGVILNAKYEFGPDTTVHYSGQSGWDAQELKLNPDYMGTVNFEAYIVDGAPYISMYTSVDGEFVTRTHYFRKVSD